jgi:hypothetical protein
MTYGERSVELNPTDSDTVTRLKKLYAEIIDIHNDARLRLGGPHAEKTGGDGEATRLHSMAISHAQVAQLISTKAAS